MAEAEQNSAFTVPNLSNERADETTLVGAKMRLLKIASIAATSMNFASEEGDLFASFTCLARATPQNAVTFFFAPLNIPRGLKSELPSKELSQFFSNWVWPSRLKEVSRVSGRPRAEAGSEQFEGKGAALALALGSSPSLSPSVPLHFSY